MRDFFNCCSSKMFFIKEVIKHRKSVEFWDDVCSIERGNRDYVEKICMRKLRAVLRNAAVNVPFYIEWFRMQGKDVENLKLEDFPIILKDTIRGHEDQFVAKGHARSLSWARTSGSTGEPFRFGRSEYDYAYATLWRGLARWGIRAGDKRVLVKGVDEVASVSLYTRIRRILYGIFNRCIVVDAHFLAESDVNVEREVKRILKYRPAYIHGYASSLYELASFAEFHGIECKELKLKAVVTESEKCHDFQREVIERVFNAPVVENYGSVEFGMIAQPARDGRLCINDDHVYVETDEDGEAIITNLDEYGFPLIRFKNGDKLTLGGIHQELPYRIITSIEGRVAETIYLPQGGSLQGYIVMYPISKHMDYIREYQVYQPDINHLLIRVVESFSLPKKIESQIVSEMRTIVGGLINVEVQKVKSIPLTKRGKRAFVCSDVKSC